MVKLISLQMLLNMLLEWIKDNKMIFNGVPIDDNDNNNLREKVQILYETMGMSNKKKIDQTKIDRTKYQ